MDKKEIKKREVKWQKVWADQDWNKGIDFDKKRKKKYVLVEFPYPSGSGLHIGHAFTMTGADVYARKGRMDGKNVIFPMGWDAFGLPTENYAIKTGISPQKATKDNTDHFRSQMKQLAFSFDWQREVNTTSPNYYKWTQWIFKELFKHGLAYKEEKAINWCPSCKIGLANEEVVDGKCERCGAEASKKNLSQWIVKITDYADRLIEGLKTTDFVAKVKAAQIKWIDRKEWIDISYDIDGVKEKIVVATTRPDTNFGATFVVIAPEYPLVDKIIKGEIKTDADIEAIKKYVEDTKKKSELERQQEVGGAKKTGVFTGLCAINQLTGKKMPIWITDFVLMTVGTGAVVGVPGHDLRDFDFAKQFDLPIVRVVVGKDGDTSEITDRKQVQEEEGTMINSGFLDGMDIHQATSKIMDYFEEKGWGQRSIRYHLRDWIFSRQHYWGEPIPMVYCQHCAKKGVSYFDRDKVKAERKEFEIADEVKQKTFGWFPLEDKDLPLQLPEVEKYQPTDTGESPLAPMVDWVTTTCPVCGKPAVRETDTMPNWAGSDWYFLRYTDQGNKDALADLEKLSYWMPVDVYIGGDEHNTLHLLYSRFICQFLWDIGAMPKSVPEPYYRRVSHGVILGSDNQRMSKSRGNVIEPKEITDHYGVDAVRTYMMFMGPFEATMAWNDNALRGVVRFLKRFENFVGQAKGDSDQRVKVIVNKLIESAGKDIDSFGYNTAIAATMETLNEMEKNKLPLGTKEAVKLAQVMAPFAPYMAEELWQKLGQKGSIHASSWPKVENKFLVEQEIEIIVQVNGKFRATVKVSADSAQDRSAVESVAKADKNVAKYLDGKTISQTIFVPGKIVNFVVK